MSNVRSRAALGSVVAALLAGLGCAGPVDATAREITRDPGADAPEAPAPISHAPSTDSPELARLLRENEERREQWKGEAAGRYAALSDEERSSLSGLTPASAEDLLGQWSALQSRALSADEEDAVRDRLESRDERGAPLHFVGRTLLKGDVLYSADDLLGASPLLEKSEIAVGTSVRPFPGRDGPPLRPDLYASKDSQLWFWRPDTTRRYYVLVPDAAPSWIFEALVLASDDLTSALSDDCLDNTFVTIGQADYDQLDSFERSLSSVIAIAYEAGACAGAADGCAQVPRKETYLLSPADSADRMRFGTFVRFDPEYDREGDGPDLTASNARYVALHELTHTLGFNHPYYPELDPGDTLLGFTLRVPTTSQGTTPTVTVPTTDPLFSFQPSTDDKQALRKVYSGQCEYIGDYRSLGQACSTTDERNCLRHGGACEVDASGGGVCRWANFEDAAACSRYSFGSWTTSGASTIPGEAGACVASAQSLPDCVSGTIQTATEDYAGRCCTQNTGAPGLFFDAFSSGYATTFFCSDQRDLWNTRDWDGNWEFSDVAEEREFSESSGNWQMSSGDYTNGANEPDNSSIGNERMTYGCIATRVQGDGSGFSGIVFDYEDANNYYVFELQPSVGRRIRRVQDGVTTTLSSVPFNYGASWSAGITLMVCYGDGIDTFIDNTSRVSLASDNGAPLSFPSARRFGLVNSFNPGGRHAYLRSFPLVQGFALLQ